MVGKPNVANEALASRSAAALLAEYGLFGAIAVVSLKAPSGPSDP
jgi:hypothetical protein